MIDNNFIDTVIWLPSDLFFGTAIATCILVLKKNKTDNNIFFIDASDECVRDANKNKLSDGNIETIVNSLKNRKSVENKAYLASYDGIKENDYDINLSQLIPKGNERRS